MSLSSKQLYLIGLPIVAIAVVHFAFHSESPTADQLQFNDMGIVESPSANIAPQNRYVFAAESQTIQLPEIRLDFLDSGQTAASVSSHLVATKKAEPTAADEKSQSSGAVIALTSPGRRPQTQFKTELSEVSIAAATETIGDKAKDTIRSTAYQQGDSEMSGGGDFGNELSPHSVLAPGSDEDVLRFHAAPAEEGLPVRGLNTARNTQRVAQRLNPIGSGSQPAQTVGTIQPPVAIQQPVEEIVMPGEVVQNTSTLPPAISTQIGQRLEYGTSLAKRGAFASAEEIYFQVVRLIAETKDSQYGTRTHTLALANGLTAFEEAQDFVSSDLRTRVRLDVGNIARAHSTTLLHEEDCSNMTTIQALQRYYEYVGEQFVIACDQEPVASDSLHYLGKLYSISPQTDPSSSAMQNAKSMIMQQAAIEANNLNHRASNELGVLLARYGRYEDARDMLIHSVSSSPDAVTWRNLASVHEQLGETKMAKLAMNESRISVERSIKERNQVSEGAIQWVEPSEFAQMPGSPQEMMAQQPRSETEQQPRVAEIPATEEQSKEWWQIFKR